MLIVNALGCTVSGARLVARRLAEAYEGERRAIFLVADHRDDFPPDRANLRFISLSHKYWGRYLRPIYEVLINLALLFRLGRIHINLSHYGWCLFGRHRVYVHSPEIVSIDPQKGFSDGKVNWFKRFCFDSCQWRAEYLYAQTQHMKVRIDQLLAEKGLGPQKCVLLRPYVTVPESSPDQGKRVVEFQYIYPVSPFAHKRVRLAERGAREASKRRPDVGLVITVEGESKEGVWRIGKQTHDEAMYWLGNSQALLFTSSQETLGLPLLEALQYELPAVLPRLAYAEEIYGDAAVYFDGEDPRAVGQAMLDLQSDYDAFRVKAVKRREHILRDTVDWHGHWSIFLGE